MTAPAATATTAGSADDASTAAGRFGFLDSVRALASWYVVLHHVWLASFVVFPENVGPWVAGWLRWGYLAVAVFIVVSGFSLALRPARQDDELRGGIATFLRRRAFRILPPYWVALIISAAVMVLYTGARAGVSTDLRAVVVHGLLLQDLIGSRPPNGAFWSIAIEWQIYFVFPALLWLTRRRGPWVMVAATVAAVIAAQLAGQHLAAARKVLDLTPQFLALFAMGIVAGRATVTSTRSAAPPRPARAAAGLGGAAIVVLLAVAPPDRVVDQYFWLSLAGGALVAFGLYLLGTDALPRSRRLLEHRPLPFLGSFSYSTYLLHIPVLAIVQHAVVNRLAADATARFVLLLALGLPAVLAATYAFHLLCERPFIEHRSISTLVASRRAGVVRPAAPAPAPAAAAATGMGVDA